MSLLVFKTNMVCDGCIQTVAAALSRFGAAIRWNTDLDDCDRILRVETAVVGVDVIVQTINEAGFVCEELTE